MKGLDKECKELFSNCDILLSINIHTVNLGFPPDTYFVQNKLIENTSYPASIAFEIGIYVKR